MSPLASGARATVSIARWLLRFRGKAHRFFRGALSVVRDACRVPAFAFAYRTTLRALAAPNHISPTSPCSRKLSSSCAYAFSQLRQERATEGQKSGEWCTTGVAQLRYVLLTSRECPGPTTSAPRSPALSLFRDSPDECDNTDDPPVRSYDAREICSTGSERVDFKPSDRDRSRSRCRKKNGINWELNVNLSGDIYSFTSRSDKILTRMWDFVASEFRNQVAAPLRYSDNYTFALLFLINLLINK